MKLVSENPNEDLLLNNLIEKIQHTGYPYIYGESFHDGFAKEMLFASLFWANKEDMYDIASWSANQRLWFLHAVKEFSNSPEWKELMEEFYHFVGVYDAIFKEETKAFLQAKKDYGLYLDMEKNIHLLHVDGFTDLMRYLDAAVVKGPEHPIKTVCTYYDKEIESQVIELNSIKVPISFKDSRLDSQAVIYAWSDADFKHSFEFFKYDLIEQKRGKETKQVAIKDFKQAESMKVKKETLAR